MTDLVIVENGFGVIEVVETSASPTIIEVVTEGPKGDPGRMSVNGVEPVDGNVTLTKNDFGLSSVENKSSSTIRGEMTSQNVSDALGFVPLPNSYVPTWASILGKPTFSNVAVSGSYNDLSDKPSSYTLPTASTLILGGVKVDGSSISISAGVISTSATAIGLGAVENKSSAAIRNEINSSNVTNALGFTPINKNGDTGLGNLSFSATIPILTFNESDQTGAAGKFRILFNNDTMSVQKNTAAAGDYSTSLTAWAVNSSGELVVNTVAVNTNSGVAASTAFVVSRIAQDAILKTGGNIVGNLGVSGTVSGISFGLVGPAPGMYYTETDQTGAAGKIRIIMDGDQMVCQKNTAIAGDYSTVATCWAIDSLGTFRSNGFSIGYLETPQNSRSLDYTLVLGDSGKHIYHPSVDTTARTFTIPANASVAFPIGTEITFVNDNGAGVISIAINSDTLRLAGAGTTGTRTLAANGIAKALKITATSWIISGSGLT